MEIDERGGAAALAVAVRRLCDGWSGGAATLEAVTELRRLLAMVDDAVEPRMARDSQCEREEVV